MADRTDAELVLECKNGNRFAFNQLVIRNQERIYWTVRRLVSDHDDAMDIVQDVFIKAFTQIKSFRGESLFSTWLYTIATNLSINALRKKKLRTYVDVDELQEVIASDAEEPSVELEREELRELIQQAIETLPEKQRIVFVLRYFEELPYEDISGIVKTSVGGLKANYYHAVRKIEDYVRHATG